MLEVYNLKKIYKVKNSDPVFALNDVSLKFPEKGFVFILGKSGSGKSTLLNVMGGLDKADEGEIIINGKSSKEFSGSEMDSYRNTYLGFIFQEYNILSDFTVKENIALALQLQHKKATDEAINSILEQVDLAGYGQRKPNELSGGQKQRVAIARALVKEPKIIFGDEPTGALDSNTGRQVFDTLKKLSKEKLVVVVSHDRDFAEHFGDRVIELKDGVVISDISKTSVESKKTNEGVSLIGDNIIRIDPNHLLDQNDLNLINEAISKSGKETFISMDASVNEAVCEAARIDKSGNREEFISTDSNKIETGNDKFSVIKSKFSLGHAFRMGAKSMRVKPVRLVFTVLLATVSFSLFGASSTLALFSTKDALASSIERNEISNVLIGTSTKTNNGYDNSFNSEYINEIKEKTGLNLYEVDSTSAQLNVPIGRAGVFDLTQCWGSIKTNQQTLDDLGLRLDTGTLPKNKNEVCISLYAYYSYEDLGIGTNVNDSTYINPANVTKDKVLNTTIKTYETVDGLSQEVEYKITGIIDTKFPQKYMSYRNNQTQFDYNDSNYSQLYSLKQSANVHNLLYKANIEETGEKSITVNDGVFFDDSQMQSVNISYYPNSDYTFFDKNKTSLDDNEIVVTQNYAKYIDDSLGYSDKDDGQIDHTYNGAYMDYLGNLSYSASIDFFSALSTSKEAAMYKVCYDNYKEFYNEHLDIIKKLNRGEYDGIDENRIHDDEDSYNNMSEDDKYYFFMVYIKYFISGYNMSTSKYINSNSYYYDDYQEAYKNYLKESFDAVGMNSYYRFLEVISMYSSDLTNEYINNNYESLYEKYKNDSRMVEIISRYEGTIEDYMKSNIVSEFWYNYSSQLDEYKEFSKQNKSKIQDLIQLIDSSKLSKKLTLYFGHDKNTKTYQIVGFDLSNRYSLLMNKETVTRIQSYVSDLGYHTGNTINYCILGLGNDNSKQDKFLQYYVEKRKPFDNNVDDDIRSGSWYISFNDSTLNQVQMISSMIIILTQVFLYVGIVLAIFSALLFYNFISVSINNKKREIGILRAVGAKRSDVFKIFYSEAFIIGLINFILSTIITFVASYFVNKSVVDTLNFNIMNPNVLIVLLLLGVSTLVSIISALLPVIKIANKKPIDAIQNR